MIRVIAIDSETGERVELEGSRIVVLAGDGDHLQMLTAGEGDTEATCEMLDDAHAKLHERSASPILSGSVSLH